MQSLGQDLVLNDSHNLLSSGLVTHTTDVLSQDVARRENISQPPLQNQVSPWLDLDTQEETEADRFCPTEFHKNGQVSAWE